MSALELKLGARRLSKRRRGHVSDPDTLRIIVVLAGGQEDEDDMRDGDVSDYSCDEGQKFLGGVRVRACMPFGGSKQSRAT